MFTKKNVLDFCSKIAALIGISIGLIREYWLLSLLFFITTIIFFFIMPSLLTRLLLKKDEREETDGEIFLWGDNDGKIEYHLTLNDPKTIPYKEFLKIRVNENARDESIK